MGRCLSCSGAGLGDWGHVLAFAVDVIFERHNEVIAVTMHKELPKTTYNDAVRSTATDECDFTCLVCAVNTEYKCVGRVGRL
jgi:hypothetical protein